MKTKNKKQNPGKVGIGKFWAWNLRQVSYGVMVLIISYVTIYCTNVLKLNAGLVGVLLLVSKIFDGFTDLVAGYLIDNTHTRFGKGRPYEFSIIFAWLCTWLLFSASPEWSTAAKALWVFSMYTLINSIFGTLLMANQTAYLIRAFANREQIERVSTLGGIVISLGTTVFAIFFPQIMKAVEYNSSAWSRAIGLLAVPFAMIGLLRFLVVKEDVRVREEKAEKFHFKDLVLVLKHNRYIYIVCLLTLLSSITSNINAGSYYFTYIVGDIGSLSILSVLGIPLVLMMFFFPGLLRKFTPVQVIRYGALIGVAGFLINLVAGSNMLLLIIAAVLTNLSYMPLCYLVTLLIIDCASYNELIGLPRMESVITAFQSFGTKIGSGFGAALAGILLGAVGFNGAATAAELSSGSLVMIRFLYGGIPAITYFLIFVCTFFFDLEKKLPEMEKKKEEQAA